MKDCIRSQAFWMYACIAALLLGIVFVWELGYLPVPSPPRPKPTDGEFAFALSLILLLAVNAGLFGYAKTKGACPVGTKSATGIAGMIGGVTLLCPVCIFIPLSLLGISVSLAFLAPFVPLFRIIAVLIAIMSIKLLWPKK